jgi:Domain of unknown function (DUF4365)
MPYRPEQHQIAGKAVAKVSEIWANIGAAIEEVRQDYGEDLLVQTCLNGKMDAARIWVQVKGTQSASGMKNPGGRTQIRVRADLALRWARTADLLVLILWDIQDDVGWYSIPALTDLHSELAEKSGEMIPLEINSENQFNARTVGDIAWHARLEHLARFVRNFRRLQEEIRDSEPGEGLWADEAVLEAVMDMMVNLDMLEPVRRAGRAMIITPQFRQLIIDTAEEIPDKPIAEVDEYLMHMILRSVLQWISRITTSAVSISLLTEMVGVVEHALELRKFRASLE